MSIPTRNGLFIHSNSNLDSLKLARDIRKEFRLSWVAIRVLDGIKNVNVKLLNDGWMIKLLNHASNNGLDVYVYHNLSGSDTKTEAERMIKRIKPYMSHSSFKGVIVRTSDGYHKRTTNSIDIYFKTLRDAYKNLDIGWADTSVAEFPSLLGRYFTKNADYVMDLITWDKTDKTYSWEYCIKSYLRYVNEFHKDKHKQYIPIVAVMDMPEIRYAYNINMLKEFYDLLMRDRGINAIGIWNAQSEIKKQPGFFSDGKSYPQLVRNHFVWTKELYYLPKPVEPEPQPEPEPEPQPDLSFSEEKWQAVYSWYLSNK